MPLCVEPRVSFLHRRLGLLAVLITLGLGASWATGCGSDGGRGFEIEDGGSKPRKSDAATPGDDDDVSDDDDDASDDDDDASVADDASSDVRTSDAGIDAGEADAGVDAGETDAGIDAGEADAGVDAGETDAGAPDPLKPSQGDLVISEVMFKPTRLPEPDGEWIEITNVSGSPKRLSGLTLKGYSSYKHVIKGDIIVQPGAYVLLVSRQSVAAMDRLPTASIVYDYNTDQGPGERILLGEIPGSMVLLLDGDKEIARARYGALGFSTTSKATIQLKVLTYAGANVAKNWCVSEKAWGTNADDGTPGKASDCRP